jgi:hypothetical protein
MERDYWDDLFDEIYLKSYSGRFDDRESAEEALAATRLVALEPPALVLGALCALSTIALRAFREPLLGGDGGLDLRTPLGARALVRRGAALLDQPARVALGLGGLVARPRRGACLTVDGVARGVRFGDLRLSGLDLGERGTLPPGARAIDPDGRIGDLA